MKLSVARVIKRSMPLFLMLLSVAIGIVSVELFYRLILASSASIDDKAMHRVVFLDGRGTIVQNHDEIFTYLPHNEIRNLTGFVYDRRYNIEYDYHFQTNNFGLVQADDIVPQRESFLFLGDSFTEGQGAEPWFRMASPQIDKLGYQPVNGGLMGTGFEQWVKLARYLAAEKIDVRKALVLFISLDYDRPVWNFTADNFNCLVALPRCQIDGSYFYRLPSPEELPSWVEKIMTARAGAASRAPAIRRSWLGSRAAMLLPATYQVYTYFRSQLVEQQSHDAVAELIRMYGAENIAFMHLPQKDELGYGPNSLGLKARHSIEKEGGRLFDGFKLCQLVPADYYANDDHPNGGGYSKVVACVTEVIKEMTAGNRYGTPANNDLHVEPRKEAAEPQYDGDHDFGPRAARDRSTVRRFGSAMSSEG
jgi:hypothetical protein